MTSSIQYQAELEVLSRKLAEAEAEAQRAQEALSTLHEKMLEEKEDVDRLEEGSFGTAILKLLNKHSGKLTREQEEFLQAKLAYEQQQFNAEEAQRQVRHLKEKIEEALKANERYQGALALKLKQMQESPKEAPRRAVFENFSLRQQRSKAVCVEIEEAMAACASAKQIAGEAQTLLASAENWAFMDTWGGGGLLTDMIKYEKLDAVQTLFRRLNAALQRLKKELADLGDGAEFSLPLIDETTRVFDVWFDNFFTDFKVKEEIKVQRAAVEQLSAALAKTEETLSRRQLVAEGALKAATEALEGVLMD